MAIVPSWWSEYLALQGGGDPTIRDASGNLVVFDPEDQSGLNPIQNAYVANDFALPASTLAAASSLALATGNTLGNIPGDPINTIVTGTTTTVIPGDDVGAILGRVVQAAISIWGSETPGIVRQPSGYMYADPTAGVRPGSIIAPRVVLPPWAATRNGRGT